MHRVLQWGGFLLFLAALCVGKSFCEKKLASFSRPTPIVTLETAKFYSRSLRKFSLGFDNLLADLIWVQLLQGASHEALNHPGVSWEFAKLHAITTLDPKFERAYSFGASFVSIFRRDKEGAKDLLERWVERRPTYWQSQYSLGFHLFHEMGLNEAAAKYILRAATLPRAPAWLTSLGIRLMSESGELFSAIQAAVGLYASVADDEGKYRLRLRIRSLNYNLQKLAWKEALGEYRKKSRREPAAVSDLEEGFAKREIAALARRIQGPEELEPLLTEKFRFRYNATTKSIEGILDDSDKSLENIGVHKKS